MSRTSKKKTRSRGKGRVVFGVVLAAVLLVVGGAYLAGYFMAGEKTPRDASVLGVHIGGMTVDQAVTTLTDELGPKAAAPISVTAGEASTKVQPAEAGLGIDYEATVAQAGAGRSWNPGHIWRVLTGGGELDPVLAVDNDKLNAAGAKVSEEFAVEASDAAIEWQDNAPALTEAVNAVEVDADEVAKELRKTFMEGDSVTVEPTVTEPEVTTAEAQQVIDEWAKPAVSGPIKITAGQAGSFQITPAMIAAATTFEKANGTIEPKVDPTALHKAAAEQIATIDVKKPKDASWQIRDGKVQVVPAVDGTDVTAKNLWAAVEKVITKNGDARTSEVKLEGAKAKFTTEMAEKAKPTKVIGSFTTYYPHANYRNVNLGQVAKKISGYTLRPGETFSMNDVVGERTAANGFVDGYVIQGGVLKKESGGGVSQGATTIFNAAFFAGLEDVEHHPHTLYFDRYPAGREATVYYGSLDLRFKNNTDHGVIVTASRSPSSPGNRGSMTVAIWGTSPWDEIRSPEPTKSGFYSGTTRTRSGPNCEYQAPIQGFTASYYRAFIKGGKEVKRENFKHTYSAGDEIKCE
ncbi:VanW family protein [Enemella sp. A6]|uniref:VanW family protein n=1 Tax=Enemella sp. A6 TaxID=3440152 RepID=UPI003EC11375